MPLTIKPPRRPSTSDTSAGPFPSSYASTRDTSPIPPLASPISPKVQPAKIKPLPNVELIDKPPSRPFSSEDATDAIALRAAISSLQVQRKRAQEDIKTLDRIRDDALTRPDEFQKHVVETAIRQSKKPAKFDVDAKEDEDEKMADSSQAFPPIPEPQHVVRCPPINWEKYHVVGEPLDRMHNAHKVGQKGVTMQYDPAVDKFDARKSSTPRDSRKDSGASAGNNGTELRPFTKVSGSR
ncbi:Hypothetical protein D9617_39g039330 [Elsinoe fawcettii]|nr:Hypothetical protein D9617_39g039330 [Elsinoe fawcettii]